MMSNAGDAANGRAKNPGRGARFNPHNGKPYTEQESAIQDLLRQSQLLASELGAALVALDKCRTALGMVHGEDFRIDEAYHAADRVLRLYANGGNAE